MSGTSNPVVASLNGINVEDFKTDGDRNEALVAAYALVSRLETPWDTVARFCMNDPAYGASLKVAKDLQLFETWHAKGDAPTDLKTLASWVGAEPLLFARIIRHLTANNVLHQVSDDTYKPTKLSIALTEPVFGEWVNYLYDATIPCYLEMPEYLKKNKYAAPLDPDDGIFQKAKNCDKDMFKYYKDNPRQGESFNHVMGGVMANQAFFPDIIPIQQFIDGSDPSTPFYVDQGGNVGHDVGKFRNRYPDLAARIYLEDRAEVLQHSKVPAPVNKVVHDFFTPQPIKGSRIYYMHGILHDWSDEPARKILENLRSALTPGYSKLLIHDHVVPESGAHPHATAYDLTMMVLLAGIERTEGQWRTLLEESGYKLIKTWRSPLAVQAVIEAELA